MCKQLSLLASMSARTLYLLRLVSEIILGRHVSRPSTNAVNVPVHVLARSVLREMT
jgi:hypothetical protein